MPAAVIGFVYVIEGGAGTVKIGHSINPGARLYQLQCGSDVRLRLAWTAPYLLRDAQKLEAAAHRFLRINDRHKHREWFFLDVETAVSVIRSQAFRLRITERTAATLTI